MTSKCMETHIQSLMDDTNIVKTGMHNAVCINDNQDQAVSRIIDILEKTHNHLDYHDEQILLVARNAQDDINEKCKDLTKYLNSQGSLLQGQIDNMNNHIIVNECNHKMHLVKITGERYTRTSLGGAGCPDVPYKHTSYVLQHCCSKCGYTRYDSAGWFKCLLIKLLKLKVEITND